MLIRIYQERDLLSNFHRTFWRPKDWATLRSTLLVPLQRKAKTFTPWAFKPFNTLSCLAAKLVVEKHVWFLQKKIVNGEKICICEHDAYESNLFDTFYNFRQLYKQNVLETGWPLHFKINADQVSRLTRHREQRCKLPVFTQLCASKQLNYWMSGLATLRSFKSKALFQESLAHVCIKPLKSFTVCNKSWIVWILSNKRDASAPLTKWILSIFKGDS